MFSNRDLWLAGAGALSAAVLSMWWRRKQRATPEELERLRRLAIHAKNRVIEGIVTDSDENTVQFSYELRGIAYFASQDIGRLREYMPGGPEDWIGPVGVKFDPANPGNSIVVCEEWSGWRTR